MNNSPQELLDIVDDDDCVIGQAERSEIYKGDINEPKNIRVIDAFIKNDKGQLFIPRRQSNKRLFPSCLDTSVGGHVDAGEEYETALIREAEEELHIDLHTMPFILLGKMTPKEDGAKAFIQVYEIKSNITPAYNIDDFSDSYWLYPHEILEMIEKGDGFKGNLPIILKKFYL